MKLRGTRGMIVWWMRCWGCQLWSFVVVCMVIIMLLGLAPSPCDMKLAGGIIILQVFLFSNLLFILIIEIDIQHVISWVMGCPPC